MEVFLLQDTLPCPRVEGVLLEKSLFLHGNRVTHLNSFSVPTLLFLWYKTFSSFSCPHVLNNVIFESVSLLYFLSLMPDVEFPFFASRESFL